MLKDVVKKTVTFGKDHKDTIIRGAAIGTIVVCAAEKICTKIRETKAEIRKEEQEAMLRRFDNMVHRGYATFYDPNKDGRQVTAQEAYDAYKKIYYYLYD